MNIKTRILINPEYLNILHNELEYNKIKVVEIDIYRNSGLYPNSIKNCIHNPIISIRYHLLADYEDIYMTIDKKGIKPNGQYDYKEIVIFREDLEVIYSSKIMNKPKTKKRKY